ncbi:hypothetical protein AX17_005628 [Amanita inopinata Kibby_2008]|nr:hypothetical protein AX17_005628 [Amanita inopinata Kibby_2008]
MVQFFDHIPDFLATWIAEQKIFWVATAPLTGEGHINLSPKGGEGTFHVVDEHTVWYEDLSGSGIETISHVRENGRITVLFNAFKGPPVIARLFGKGTIYEFDTPEYNALIHPDERKPGSRAVIMVTVHKVSTSCGYAVPFYDYRAERTRLAESVAKREAADNTFVEASTPASSSPDLPNTGLKWYWQNKNAKSIDGLPGIQTAFLSSRRFNEYKLAPSSAANEEASSNDGKSARVRAIERLPMTSMAWIALVFGSGVILSKPIFETIKRVGDMMDR